MEAESCSGTGKRLAVKGAETATGSDSRWWRGPGWGLHCVTLGGDCSGIIRPACYFTRPVFRCYSAAILREMLHRAGAD